MSMRLVCQRCERIHGNNKELCENCEDMLFGHLFATPVTRAENNPKANRMRCALNPAPVRNGQ